MLLCVYSLINLLILCNYLLIDLLIFCSFDHLFLQSTSCAGYNIFNTARSFVSQSVSPAFFLFVSATSLKLWNRISWNFVVMMDILGRKTKRRYSMIWRWIWNLFNERDRIFYIFSRVQSDVDNENPNVWKCDIIYRLSVSDY